MTEREIAEAIAAQDEIRKPRRNSRTARLNRLSEIRSSIQASPAVAAMIESHDASQIVVRSL